MNNLIIACSGASHSGKTTFMEKISNDLNNVVLIDEKIRDYNINIDEIRKDPKAYLDLEIRIINDKIEDEIATKNKENSIILIDRSLVDSYFYYTFYTDKSSYDQEDLQKYHDFLFKLNAVTESHINNMYDYIFLFSPLRNHTRRDNYTQRNLALTQENEYQMMRTLTLGFLSDQSKMIDVSAISDYQKMLQFVRDEAYAS